MMKEIKTTRAARILGVTPETLRNYVHDELISRLPYRGFGRDIWRFDQGEVEAFRDGGPEGASRYRKGNRSAVA